MNQMLQRGILKSVPRKWTVAEESELLELSKQNKTNQEISEILGRTNISVSLKIKRLAKKNNTYNSEHKIDKYLYNNMFLEYLKPRNILDVYAGNTFYKKSMCVTTNDVDRNMPTDYHLDAFVLCCKMICEKRKFDLVDLDPFGSAADVFPLALKIAKKGIIITLGEMGHQRFKRLDFVKKWYGIKSFEEFTVERIISELQTISKRYRKQITPVYVCKYRNLARVYFKISDYRENEQWGGL